MGVERALLLIADIGGYTRFMRIHRINLAHAQYIVARLLEAVIDASGGRWKLAKLEGDAAFFYSVVKGATPPDLEATARALLRMRDAFQGRRDQISRDRICSCDSCVQSGELKLKFVVHEGEIAFQKVKRLTELCGVDVIFVHRLLKNSVPVPEYVLMSEAVRAGMPDPLGPGSHELAEELEGLGPVRTYYFDFDSLPPAPAVDRVTSRVRRVWQWLRMTCSALPYMLGARESCKGFRNMPGVEPPALEGG